MAAALRWLAMPSRLPRAPKTFTIEQLLPVLYAAAACLYVIVLTGATVRLTGSGLGCPNWPSCHGTRPVPEIQAHQLIEFGNRMVSLPTLLFTALAVWMAGRVRPLRRDVRRGTRLCLAGVLAQIPLGGVTVLLKLHPLAVAMHFLLSIAILGAVTYTIHAARLPDGDSSSRVRARGGDRWSAIAVVVTCAVVVVTGMLVTAAGPHSGAAVDSPVRRLTDWQLYVDVHARFVFAFTAFVAWTTWRRRTREGARDFAVLTGLVLVQIAIGEYQYRTGLPWQAILGHVAMACLIWVTSCWIALQALRGRAAVPAPTAPGGEPELAIASAP